MASRELQREASRELQREAQLQSSSSAAQPSALPQPLVPALPDEPFRGARAISEQHGGTNMFAPVPEDSSLGAEHVWPADGDEVFGDLENLNMGFE
jgi:hypothetical protein